jgi:hypothetical protein
MALASSKTLMGDAPVMTDKIAKEDITEVNENGQTVVVVPAGMPIPEGVDVPKTKATTEDKARRSSKGKSDA